MSAAAPVSTSGGAAMPTNSFDLMRQLRAAEREQNKAHSNQQKENRFKKLELQRESYERQLLETEDYTHTSEGVRRSKAYEDRIQM